MGELTDGVAMTGTDEAVGHCEAALEHLLYFRAAVGREIEEALSAEPDIPMGQVFAAYLGLLGTEAADATAARDVFTGWRCRAADAPMNERELQHVAAAQAWLDGDMIGAGRTLAELTLSHPRDLLALAVGHQIDFFTGDAVMLRDRIAGALAAWSPDERGYGFVLGMLAFGLEESGLYGRSGDVGAEAVDRDGRDVWAIHAVVHTYEMRGRFGEGLAFLDGRVADWSGGNYFNVHNWWHYCLYALEAGRPDLALRIYDAVLDNEESQGLVMEMLDAASLLWRLYLGGDDQTVRFRALADAWDAKMATPYYAFNDMHAVMSYVGAGMPERARALLKAREDYVSSAAPRETNRMVTAEVGLPVCKAMLAFGEERYGDVVHTLWPMRRRINLVGGSHAQRDAVQRTLLEAAIRLGESDIARQLSSERLSVNPDSPYNWRQQARLLDAVGSRARAARDTAGELDGGGAVFSALSSLP